MDKQLCGLDARDIRLREGHVCFVDGIEQIDGASGVFDHYGFEAVSLAIKGGVADAEVIGEAAEEEAGEVAFAKVAGEACWRGVVVFEER